MAENAKPITLTEISTNLNIPKSSALDILYTLVEKGLVEIDNPDFKTYRLGIALFTLGAVALNRNDLHTISHKLLAKLSETTKKTSFLGVPKQEKIVYISKIEGSSPVQSSCSIGSTNPMYFTGIGKAFLATMSDDEIEDLYGKGPYKRRTAQTLTTLNDLMEDIDKTRKRGYSIDDREGVEFIYCFGAPIYDYTNKAIASISLVSIVDEIGEEEKSQYPPLLVGIAMEISRKLGFAGNKFY